MVTNFIWGKGVVIFDKIIGRSVNFALVKLRSWVGMLSVRFVSIRPKLESPIMRACMSAWIEKVYHLCLEKVARWYWCCVSCGADVGVLICKEFSWILRAAFGEGIWGGDGFIGIGRGPLGQSSNPNVPSRVLSALVVCGIFSDCVSCTSGEASVIAVSRDQVSDVPVPHESGGDGRSP